MDASQRDFETTHVMLVTDVANAYFNLLAADEMIDLQKDLITTGENDLFHSQRRFEAGLVNEEDIVLRQGRQRVLAQRPLVERRWRWPC